MWVEGEVLAGHRWWSEALRDVCMARFACARQELCAVHNSY